MKSIMGLIAFVISTNVYSQELYMKLVDDSNKPNGYLVIQEELCKTKISDELMAKLKGEDKETEIILYNAYVENVLGEKRNACWFRSAPLANHTRLVVILEEYAEGLFNIGSFSQIYFKTEK